MATSPSDFSKASPEMLQEILREAESYLGAQLSSGIAADTRAISFVGLISAAAALIAGAAASLLISDKSDSLGWAAMLTAAVFVASIRFAIRSASPVAFCYPGNSPEMWVDDARANRKLTESLAEQVHYSAEQIQQNKQTLEKNARLMKRALNIAWVGLAYGGEAAILILLLR